MCTRQLATSISDVVDSRAIFAERAPLRGNMAARTPEGAESAACRGAKGATADESSAELIDRKYWDRTCRRQKARQRVSLLESLVFLDEL